MLRIKGLLNGVKWATLNTLSKSLIQVVQIGFLARILETEAFGVLAIAQFMISVCYVILELGLNAAVFFKQQISNKEFSSLWWFNLTFSAVLLILTLTASPFVSDFYNDGSLKIVLQLLSVNFVFASLGRLHRTILEKNLKFKLIFVVETAGNLIGLLVSIILALKGFGVLSVVYSTLITIFLQNITFFIVGAKTYSVLIKPSFMTVNPLIKIGVYQLGSRLVDFASKNIDVLIIGKIIGIEQLGIYNLLKQIASRLYFILNHSINTVFVPYVSSLKRDAKTNNKVLLESTKGILYVNSLFFFVLIIMAETAIFLLLGETYLKHNLILIIISLGLLLETINIPIFAIIISSGKTYLSLYLSAAKFFMTTALVYYASFGDLSSVAVSILISSLISIPFGYFFLSKKIIDIKPALYFYSILKPVTHSFLYYFIIRLIFYRTESVFYESFSALVYCLIFLTFIYFSENKTIKFFINEIIKKQ